jgi:hypothetical protein
MSSTHDYIIPCLGVYPIKKHLGVDYWVYQNFLHGDTVFWGFGTGPSRRKASWDFFTSFLLANSILKFGNA